MKKILTAFVLLLSLSCFADVTQNLVNPTGWSNVTTTTGCGGVAGGTQAAYLTYTTGVSTGIICWGYMQSTIAQTIAINKALSGTGIQVQGYNYSWDYYNSDYHSGTLSALISLKDSKGVAIESYSYAMNDDTASRWKSISGTQDFKQQYALSAVSNLDVSFTGKDNRYWAGWYGPAIRNVNVALKYGVDLCASDPLSSTSCPNYQQAYHDQQCSINPLYMSDCPGYAQAYHDQQCSINPLYAVDCPGYQQAFFKQQCTASPLYSVDCPGYAEAYFNRQCELDGLYDTKCPNYSTAYAKKMLFEQQGIATAVDVAGTTAKNDPANTTTTVAAPVTTTTNTTTQPEATSVTSTTSVSPAAVISVVKAPEPLPAASPTQQAMQPPPPPPQQQQQKQQEERKTENQVANKMEKNMSGEKGVSQNKEKMKEAVAKVQKEIVKDAKEAKSFESQSATQGLVLGAMNYVPGFDAYKNAMIPDVNDVVMSRLYGKPVIDNRNAQRRLSLASDMKWQQMVDSQYQIGK